MAGAALPGLRTGEFSSTRHIAPRPPKRGAMPVADRVQDLAIPADEALRPRAPDEGPNPGEVWDRGNTYLQARMEESPECMFVLIGATPAGKQELVGFQTGVREARRAGASP